MKNDPLLTSKEVSDGIGYVSFLRGGYRMNDLEDYYQYVSIAKSNISDLKESYSRALEKELMQSPEIEVEEVEQLEEKKEEYKEENIEMETVETMEEVQEEKAEVAVNVQTQEEGVIVTEAQVVVDTAKEVEAVQATVVAVKQSSSSEVVKEVIETVENGNTGICGQGLVCDAISMGAGFVPVVGDLLDAYAAVSGVDPITGEKLSWVDRGLSLVGVLPIPGVSGKNLRLGKEGLGKVVDTVVDCLTYEDEEEGGLKNMVYNVLGVEQVYAKGCDVSGKIVHTIKEKANVTKIWSDAPGGDNAAKKLYKELTGQNAVEPFSKHVSDGVTTTYRPASNSKSGMPKIEINNTIKRLYEKISFWN